MLGRTIGEAGATAYPSRARIPGQGDINDVSRQIFHPSQITFVKSKVATEDIRRRNP